MARIEIDVDINRPVEEVFDFVSNSENLPRWRATALAVKKASAGPLTLGGIFRGRFTFLGRQFDGNLEVTAHQANHVYATKMTAGPFPLETRYTFEAIEGGTRIHFVMEGEPGGFFKMAEPVVVNVARRSYETDLQNLKDILEAQALQSAS